MSDATNKTKIVLYAGKRLSLALAWFDLWIGFYVDPAAGTLYWCPLPCVVVAWRYGKLPCPRCNDTGEISCVHVHTARMRAETPDGTPHVRDVLARCADYVPGLPDGRCEGDGHYLCDECTLSAGARVVEIL